jgi:hypothetical protein
VWSVLSDFAAYGSWMPLTRMRTDPGTPHAGWGFAGVSGVGPLHFTDSMVVTDWSPPQDTGAGRFRVVKTGWLLGGWAQARVERDGSGSRVVWDQHLQVRPVPSVRPVDTVVERVAGGLYARAVDAMLARAEGRGAERPAPGPEPRP